MAPEAYKLGSLRYDPWKLRAKGLVEKIPHSRRYRLLPPRLPDLSGVPKAL
jgi:hypothetical protein